MMTIGLDRQLSHADARELETRREPAVVSSSDNEEHLIELMGRYCDGDAAAFDHLYKLAAPRLLRYLVGLVGERAAAEDLLQQTFLKVHQSRVAYIRGARPLPWIYTIAHRTCLDELRRRKHARVRLGRKDVPAVEPRADITGRSEGEDGGASRYDAKLTQAAMAALARLPQSQREALLLTKVHGRSVAEAAAIAGTTAGAIKLRAHRGYVTLRRILGGDGDQGGA